MNILGVMYGHNATICLIQNGEISFCQSEERLNRIKNSTGFPEQTLDFIYKNICGPDKIDAAALFQNSVYGYSNIKAHGFKPYQYGEYLDPSLMQAGLKQILLKTEAGWKYQELKTDLKENNKSLRQEAHQYFASSLKLPPEKLLYIDHHLAHAYSTVPNTADWGNTLVFTADGVGDWACATVNILENGSLDTISRTNHRNSLGYYYACTTSILGMKAGEHEFKVMGLAPYAKSEYYSKILEKLRDLLTIDDQGEWHSKVNPAALMDTLEKIYRYQRFDNVAGAIQALTEELLMRWISFWIKKTGCRNIAVAGGVFMNVKACQKVAEMPCVDKIFVAPSGADESTAIGSAVWAYGTLSHGQGVKPLESLALGMEFSDRDIEYAILQTGATERYEITRPDDINVAIGTLIAENKIVARCTGRMEFGARALGNRSILANPSSRENLHVINEAIKCRDFWMPFCPSILEEDMHRYIQNHEKIFAPYMCITFNSTKEARKDIVAALHPKDATVRPQCVTKSANPDYYRIISTFKELTGIGSVLNTSFNLHGEPNVCSPFDAIRTVDNSGLEYMAMNGFLFRKKNSTGGL